LKRKRKRKREFQRERESSREREFQREGVPERESSREREREKGRTAAEVPFRVGKFTTREEHIGGEPPTVDARGCARGWKGRILSGTLVSRKESTHTHIRLAADLPSGCVCGEDDEFRVGRLAREREREVTRGRHRV
jgi:hypothetical protein